MKRITTFLILCLVLNCLCEPLTAIGQVKSKQKTKTPKVKIDKKAKTSTAPVDISNDKLDLHKKPDPLPTREFLFPKYTEMKTHNGVKVYIVEDHEQPTINFRLQLVAGEVRDGEKLGVAQLTADLLTKGAGAMTAQDIANKLDGVGASITASSQGESVIISGECMKKHMQLLFVMLNDIVTKPTFSQDEFDKIKAQTIAGMKAEKSRPGMIMQNVARKVIYGENHPYSRKRTEESVKNLTLSDVKEFYGKFYRPNNHAVIAVVGDVTPREIMPYVERGIGDWKSAPVAELELPEPKPMPLGVYYVKRPGSVQSSFSLSSLAVPAKHPDYDQVRLAASYIGSSFGGRLFRTLREKHSYTYTPFGFVSSARAANRCVFGADVRNAVTDSAILVTINELRELAQRGPDEESLRRIQKADAGKYLTSFENSDFVASILLNAEFNEVPLDNVKDYPTRLLRMNAGEVESAASQYMNPESMRLVVVGSPDVKPMIERFGKIYEYDMEANPVKASAFEKVNLSGDDVIAKYVTAIGGEEKMKSVKTLVMKGKAKLEMQGRTMEGVVEVQKKEGRSGHQMVDFKIFKSETWVDGNHVVGANGTEKQDMEGDEKEKEIFDATLFNVTKLPEFGYTLEVIGKRDGEIHLKAIDSKKRELLYRFDEKTFLLNAFERSENTPQGEQTTVERYSNYVEVGGVKFPLIARVDAPFGNITYEVEYQVNTPLDDSLFTPSH